ncbi:hypothetical protein F5888DRAFT_1803921 [Russula emetica]|nr:hypothetical protein F5888DRAFT_1803921 [Russula emetica]
MIRRFRILSSNSSPSTSSPVNYQHWHLILRQLVHLVSFNLPTSSLANSICHQTVNSTHHQLIDSRRLAHYISRQLVNHADPSTPDSAHLDPPHVAINTRPPHLPISDSRAYGELIFVRSYLNAFRSLCTGMFMLMLPELRQPASRLALNFVRRYKWVFRPEYARLRPQVAAPDLSAFASTSAEVLREEQEPLRLHF